jgi:hypothetical protein
MREPTPVTVSIITAVNGSMSRLKGMFTSPTEIQSIIFGSRSGIAPGVGGVA